MYASIVIDSSALRDRLEHGRIELRRRCSGCRCGSRARTARRSRPPSVGRNSSSSTENSWSRPYRGGNSERRDQVADERHRARAHRPAPRVVHHRAEEDAAPTATTTTAAGGRASRSAACPSAGASGIGCEPVSPVPRHSSTPRARSGPPDSRRTASAGNAVRYRNRRAFGRHVRHRGMGQSAYHPTPGGRSASHDTRERPESAIPNPANPDPDHVDRARGQPAALHV